MQPLATTPATAGHPTNTAVAFERSQDDKEVLIFRDGSARVRSGVMRLRQDGRIGDAEVVAQERWYRDYVFVEYDATCPSRRAGASATPGGRMDARVDAAASYRAACRSLGPSATRVLIDVVANEIAISKAAPKHGFDRNAFPGVVAAALRRLAEHYADADSHRPQTH